MNKEFEKVLGMFDFTQRHKLRIAMMGRTTLKVEEMVGLILIHADEVGTDDELPFSDLMNELEAI